MAEYSPVTDFRECCHGERETEEAGSGKGEGGRENGAMKDEI